MQDISKGFITLKWWAALGIELKEGGFGREQKLH